MSMKETFEKYCDDPGHLGWNIWRQAAVGVTLLICLLLFKSGFAVDDIVSMVMVLGALGGFDCFKRKMTGISEGRSEDQATTGWGATKPPSNQPSKPSSGGYDDP